MAPVAGMRVEFEPRGTQAFEISPVAGAPPTPVPTPTAAIPTATGATLPARSYRTAGTYSTCGVWSVACCSEPPTKSVTIGTKVADGYQEMAILG